MISISNPELKFIADEPDMDIIALKIIWERDRELWNVFAKRFPVFCQVDVWNEEKVGSILKEIYPSIRRQLNDSRSNFEIWWRELEKDVYCFFNDFFQAKSFFQKDNFYAAIGIAPISPRDIAQKRFLVQYYLNKKELLTKCIHEISHFYFYKKIEEFNIALGGLGLLDDKQLWILSELIVPFLLRDKRFATLLGEVTLSSYVCKPVLLEKVKPIYEKRLLDIINIEDFFLELARMEIKKDELNAKYT